ncbi:hypothetical protein [Bacillus sp. Marseille-P3661]|uniref:hypothetical protein n=1 Tax=Bacillus sp. Marseille-P3661 TaxID=1936234 RepID=UPI000C84D248|nr:hypothetical protein [Bacillus sp. Marseille-P3661]
MSNNEQFNRFDRLMFGNRNIQKQTTTSNPIQNIDLTSIINNVDQIMNTVNQVKPVIQQITPLLSIFNKK